MESNTCPIEICSKKLPPRAANRETLWQLRDQTKSARRTQVQIPNPQTRSGNPSATPKREKTPHPIVGADPTLSLLNVWSRSNAFPSKCLERIQGFLEFIFVTLGPWEDRLALPSSARKRPSSAARRLAVLTGHNSHQKGRPNLES